MESSNELVKLLSDQKKLINSIHSDDFNTLSKLYICATCKYKGSGEAYDCFCNLHDTFAKYVRKSFVNCDDYKIHPEQYSTGYFDTKKGKHYVTHDGNKIKRARKRRENFKFCVNIIRGLLDSFKVDDFYPLRAALRGETYELEKKKTSKDRRDSTKTSNPAEKSRR